MKTEGFIAFLEAQGLRVFEAQGALWTEKRAFFLENFPPHRRAHLDDFGVYQLFARGAAAIRYTCSEEEGESTYEYVCAKDSFSLESLSPDARRRIRRGLESCDVRPVECDLIARFGCAINKSTLSRQGRAGRNLFTEEALWKQYMLACARIPCVEALGAFVKNRLIGYSISVTADDYCYLHHTQAYTEYLKYSPVNALTYSITKMMLERPGINFVSQGLEAFFPQPELERFKLSMGFGKRELCRRLVINPLARPLFSSQAVWLARKTLGAFRPGLAEDLATFSSAFRLRSKSSNISRAAT